MHASRAESRSSIRPWMRFSMSYDIELSDLAKEQLRGQAATVQHIVTSAFRKLAESPTKISRPSSSPTGGQYAEIKHVEEGVVLWVTMTFRYGQDEQMLHIEQFDVEFGE